MKLDKHYFTLYSVWGPTSKDVFISDIAKRLSCSNRHAKSVIKQMTEKQWINWEPSPGRGKASKLTFLLKPNEIEEQNVRSWIEEGDIVRALKWMENQAELEASFVKWLEGQFQWTPSHRRDDGMDVLSYQHIFNRLLQYRYEDNTFLPELAHYWESKENGRVWRFYLRKGLLFHGGSPLTSKTIMENILFWKREQIAGWKLTVLDEIEKMETPSSTMIDIYLTKPNKLFLHMFTDNKSMIIPVQLYEKNKEAFRFHPIGSGPYQMADHRHGHMILEAFPHYFGFRPLLDKVELYDIPNSPLPPARQVHYRIVDRHSTTINKFDWFRPEIGGVYLVVNDRKEGIHKHPEFRRILSYAIDRTKLFQNHPHHEV